ncbi:LPS-assembly protein LptD [Thalassolituus marinus]|uniref:LPS-assembly protein LptD n=1 Tax=Thalassolituus marinus TaxID=671053 RepID=A0ABS7ZUZ8_9GAMM|nr:LPS assembly protein LptD [Thalassolituus marinus]MCA6064235.1 LPS assembly protein LptD [Thalassolituus marinus]
MIRIRPHNVRKAPARQSIGLRTLLSVVAAVGFIPTAGAASTAHLSWYPRDLLTDEEQDALPDFCHGNYRVAEIEPIEGQQIEVEADQSLVSKSGDTQLQGDVVMRQADRQVNADTAYWYQQRGFAEFRGNVTLQSPEVTLHGDSADFDQTGGQLTFRQAEYSVPQRHFRGSAASIDSSDEGRIDLADATFTFCEPGHNDWDLKASELHLDQEAGIGSAWHARLRVKEVPVMYVPYYRFPIGDQRMTGFLDPSFSLNGMGQAEDVQIPFYWNIAANADATLIAHHILDRGLLWESQFRHKTALLGDGELNYGYLADDETEGEERWLINYQQDGKLGAGWSHSWVYNHISDNDYLSDMNPQAAVDRTTHLPRRGQIQWNGGHWYFDVIGESFQTIDDTIALSSRPYRRLPQMNLTFSQSVINDWQFSQKLQVTRFNRDSEATIADNKQVLSGFSALNGDRLLSDSSVAYPFEWPFGFLTPKIEYRYRAYQLTDDDDTLSDEVDLDVSHGTGKYSVDGGLYFDREFSWFGNDYQQTLEPRVFWVRSPYLKDQNLIPNFDSARTTVTYASLFTGDRFTGGDRLADLDQVSTGLTTRFIRGDGLEQFRASIGRIWYNEDRLVQLTGTSLPEADTQSISSTLGEVEFNPDLNWSLYHTIEWDEYKDFARQRRYGVRYESTDNRFLNLATNTVQSWNSGTEKVVTTTRQIDAGFFWSLNDRWAVVGRQLRDMLSYDSDEKRPVSPVLESLAGFEYQNCCWRVQLLYRETSPKDTSADAEFTTDKRYGFMLSIQLKGLSTFGSGTDDVINEGITGYSRRQYHDY